MSIFLASRRGFMSQSCASFLQLGMKSAVGRLVAVPIAASIATPNSANAFPVAAALSVAASVCGMLGTKKSGDGGMGAMLSASLEYQRVMSKQLTSIQLGLAEILAKINSLEPVIRNMLYLERMARLQAEIGGCIILYRQAITESSVFDGGYEAWSTNDVVRSKLFHIMHRLADALAEVEHGGWADATTSLYLPAAAFTSMGVNAALGMPRSGMMASAQEVLDLMARAADPEIQNSAAASLRQRIGSMAKLSTALSNEGLILPDIDKLTGISLRLGSVRVQDYYAGTTRTQEKCKTVHERRGGGGRKGGNEGGGSENFNQVCWIETVQVNSPRQGPVSAFELSLRVEPKFVRDPKNPDSLYSVRQWEPAPDLSVQEISVAGQPLLQADAPSTPARQAASLTSDVGTQAQAKATRLRALLARHNDESAYAALNAGALFALSQARQDVFTFFGVKA